MKTSHLLGSMLLGGRVRPLENESPARFKGHEQKGTPPPHGPWFGAVDLYFPVFYAYFCFLDLCQNWGEGHTCIWYACMHTDVIKSNDISTCNLKEFECIQEYKNNSDISKKY